MQQSIRNVILSLLVWYAIVGCALLGLSVVAHEAPSGPEARSYLIRAFWLGILVIVWVWPICRMLSRVPGTWVGTALGLSIPILAGWIWAHWIEGSVRSWGLLWNGTDLWIQGLQIAIPSAIAGGIIGYFLSRKNRTRTSRADIA